jgi:hypothetical protein
MNRVLRHTRSVWASQSQTASCVAAATRSKRSWHSESRFRSRACSPSPRLQVGQQSQRSGGEAARRTAGTGAPPPESSRDRRDIRRRCGPRLARSSPVLSPWTTATATPAHCRARDRPRLETEMIRLGSSAPGVARAGAACRDGRRSRPDGLRRWRTIWPTKPCSVKPGNGPLSLQPALAARSAGG